MLEFLNLDHVNPLLKRGKHHKRGGRNLYVYLKRRGWPKANLQILCFNCNLAKGAYGTCPHTWDNVDLVRARYLCGEDLGWRKK